MSLKIKQIGREEIGLTPEEYLVLKKYEGKAFIRVERETLEGGN